MIANDAALLVRTNRGLVLDGDTARLLCNEALGINTAEVPSIVAMRDGRWLIGSSRGLAIWSADLCSSTGVEPLADIAVGDLTRVPATAARILASSERADFDNGLFVSDDDGVTFAAHGTTDTQRVYDHVVVSPASPDVFYASGLRLRDGGTGFISFVAASNDGGLNFVEHPFELKLDEYAFDLLAAHPTDPRKIYAVARANLGTGIMDRLLVSNDGGETFSETLSPDKLGGLVLDADGSTVYVGARDGLWRSSDSGATFARVQARPIHCATQTEGALYVCDEDDGMAGVSVSRDGGETLRSVLRFTDVTAPVECSSDSAVRQLCATPWSDWLREQQAGFGADAGPIAGADSGVVTDAAAADSGRSIPPRSTDGGCSARSPTAARHGWQALGALACWITLSVRRRVRSKELSP